jgi:hypothetical protein
MATVMRSIVQRRRLGKSSAVQQHQSQPGGNDYGNRLANQAGRAGLRNGGGVHIDTTGHDILQKNATGYRWLQQAANDAMTAWTIDE